MTRATAYVRVSTDRQHTENQEPDLARLAAARGWELEIRREVEGATKRRPVLEQLMADARKGNVSVLLIWSIDRLDRSMLAFVQRLAELERLNVRVVSYSDSWLDTGVDNPARPVLVGMMSGLAQMEHRRIVERTRAGLARARAEGTKLGRPGVSPILLRAAADRVRAGVPMRRAAKALGVPYSSLQRHMHAGAQ